MNDDKQQKASTLGGNGNAMPNTQVSRSSILAFSLVVVMLGILLVLVLVLLNLPKFFDAGDTRIDYYKQAFSVLIGAFGAWIGAGAAHFFGRENLNESSRSTEAVLKIQREAQRGQPQSERIKDLKLMVMNNDFMFRSDQMKKDVTTGLNDHRDFWFVPILQKGGTGILEDIVHARVF